MFTPEEAQKLTESIYQSWKAGDTVVRFSVAAEDRWNWFMVKMNQENQDLCAERLKRECLVLNAT